MSKRAAVGKPARAARSAPAPESFGARETWIVVAALAALWLVLFAPQLAGGTFTLGDARDYGGFAAFSRERFALTHEATHWNPFVFLGLPASASLADPRPQWLPWPLLAAWDAFTVAAPLLPVLLALMLGACCAAALARALWRAGLAACVLAGAGWLLAPQVLVPLAFGHGAEAIALALLPAMLLAVHHVFAAPDAAQARAAALGLALALGGAVLGGHPQFAAYGACTAVAFACERAVTLRRTDRAPLAAGALLLGVALACVVWLPAWLYGRESVRASASVMAREADTFRAGGRDLLSALWPHAAGYGGATYFGAMRATDYPHYVGAVLALLALVGLFAAAREGRAAAWLCAGLVAFALLAAPGAHGPVGAVLAHLPLFSAFRTPISWLVLAQVGVLLLAARGLDAALRLPARLWWIGGAVLLALAAWLFTSPAGPLADAFANAMANDPRHALDAGWADAVRVEPVTAVFDLGLRLALAALAAFALGFAARGGRAARIGAFVAVVIAAADLASIGLSPLRRSSGRASDIAPPPPSALAQAAAGDSLHRAFPQERTEFFSNAWVHWRVRQVAGLHGAAPRRWDDLRSNGLLATPAFVRALAVRWMPASGGVPPAPEDVDTLASGVRRLVHALPRVYPVVTVTARPNDDAVVAAMKAPEFDPSHEVFTTDRTIARAYYSSDDATVNVVRDDPDRLEIATQAIGPVFVVIADLWMPGWSVTIDGHAATLARVDHVLRGVPVTTAGSHRITLAYTPPGWTLGRAITWAAWLVWLLGAASVLAARRRTTSAPSAPQSAAASA